MPGLSLLLALLPSATGLVAQGPTWASPYSGPSARSSHAMVFDEARGRCVTFGGDLVGETWEREGTNWIRRTPQHSPSPRGHAAMAHDPVRGVTVLFGGFLWGGGLLQDTWEWDGEDWRQVTTPTSPPAMDNAALVWHGGTNPGVLLFAVTQGVGQTWSYDGTTWTLRANGGPTSYPARARMAYVATTQRTYMLVNSPFTGLGELFAWDGSAWSLVLASTTGPSAFSSNGGMVYDPDRDVLVAAGSVVSATQTVLIDLVSPTVAVAAPFPATYGPGVMNEMKFVYDSARRCVVAFGGFGVTSGDTDIVRELPSSAGPAPWLLYQPVTAAPPPRQLFDMAYNPTLYRTVLFGGYDPQGNTLGDTWVFDGRTWTNHGTGLGAGPRLLSSLAFLAGSGTVMFGGATAIGGTYLNDTLIWNGNTWFTLFSLVYPPARYSHDLVSGAGDNAVYLFGGYNGVYLSDTWRLGSTGWQQLTPTNTPPARAAHRLAYDQRRDRVVLFGGQGVNATMLGDTWELSTFPFPQWTQVAPAQSPNPRWGHMMNYDPTRGVVVMTGGYGQSLPTGGSLLYRNDVWEYDGVTWRERTMTAEAPQARESAGFAWDAANRRFVLQGGFGAFNSYPTSTWLYGAPVDVPGVGTPANPRRLRATTFPVAGRSFGLSFDNPSTFGWVLVDATPVPTGIALPTLSLFCSQVVLHGQNYVIADALGNPGTLTFQIPLAQLGLGFTCQGVSLTPALCLELTDPLLVTPQAP